MPYAICPECDGDVYLKSQPSIGDRVDCPHCETELEVVSLHPVELDWPWDDDEESEEWDDWDDDDDW